MKAYKRVLCFFVILAMSASLAACGESSADYPDAASLETALSNGENPEG